MRMKRIVNPVVPSRGLTANQQQGVLRAVVNEAMANAGAGGKSCKLPCPHPVKKAIYPGVDLSLEHVCEFLLLLLGMRPRASLARRQAHQVHAEPEQTRGSADGPLVAGEFVAVGVTVERLGN